MPTLLVLGAKRGSQPAERPQRGGLIHQEGLEGRAGGLGEGRRPGPAASGRGRRPDTMDSAFDARSNLAPMWQPASGGGESCQMERPRRAARYLRRVAAHCRAVTQPSESCHISATEGI